MHFQKSGSCLVLNDSKSAAEELTNITPPSLFVFIPCSNRWFGVALILELFLMQTNCLLPRKVASLRGAISERMPVHDETLLPWLAGQHQGQAASGISWPLGRACPSGRSPLSAPCPTACRVYLFLKEMF